MTLWGRASQIGTKERDALAYRHQRTSQSSAARFVDLPMHGATSRPLTGDQTNLPDSLAAPFRDVISPQWWLPLRGTASARRYSTSAIESCGKTSVAIWLESENPVIRQYGYEAVS